MWKNILIGVLGVLLLIVSTGTYSYFMVSMDLNEANEKELTLKIHIHKVSSSILAMVLFMKHRNMVEDPLIQHLWQEAERIAAVKSSISDSANVWPELKKDVSEFTTRFDNDQELNKNDTYIKFRNDMVCLSTNLDYVQKEYNVAVAAYNLRLHVVPFNYVAKISHLREKEFFIFDKKVIDGVQSTQKNAPVKMKK